MAVSDQVCPDPSAHQKSHQSKGLQDQAATAALYVTHPERGTNVRDMNPLGPDGKLSSAGSRAFPLTAPITLYTDAVPQELPPHLNTPALKTFPASPPSALIPRTPA